MKYLIKIYGLVLLFSMGLFHCESNQPSEVVKNVPVKSVETKEVKTVIDKPTPKPIPATFDRSEQLTRLKDKIAKGTVEWLKTNLPHKPAQTRELSGEHLTPMGYRQGDPALVETVLKFLKAL